MSGYLIVIEKAGKNYSAYCPDLPGCVAAAKTRAATERLMREAIRLHLDAMRADGLVPPAPSSTASIVAVSLASR